MVLGFIGPSFGPSFLMTTMRQKPHTCQASLKTSSVVLCRVELPRVWQREDVALGEVCRVLLADDHGRTVREPGDSGRVKDATIPRRISRFHNRGLAGLSVHGPVVVDGEDAFLPGQHALAVVRNE